MKLATQILLAFSIIILISVLDAYINYRLSLKVQKSTDFVSTSEAIIRNSTSLHKNIIEMQSGFRGFLLTSDTTFLVPFNTGIGIVKQLFLEQRELIKGSTTQMSRLDSIENLHHQWLNYSVGLIKAKKILLADNISTDYDDLFETKLKKQVGKKLNDEITGVFRRFDRHEYRIRQARRSQLITSIERTHWVSMGFLLLKVLVGVGSTLYIVNLTSKRISSMVTMAENISKGEFSVINDTRHDELTGLSTSLNIMSDTLSRNISQLEKTNTELNQFAYVVSHDLKAPVRGIYNVIQWIEEDLGNELSPELKRYLNIIPQRTRRMEDLINGLLDYARIRHKTQLEKVDTNLLIKEITEVIVPREFKVETYNLPEVFTERLKLEQVFTNLISNAVKYTPHPHGLIIVSCVKNAEHFEFSVKDNGMGIDPEYHTKIFELFQTLRERDEKESTGIGLAIIKKIIDDQHCDIRVISKAGKGAEFIFTWPVNKNITV